MHGPYFSCSKVTNMVDTFRKMSTIFIHSTTTYHNKWSPLKGPRIFFKLCATENSIQKKIGKTEQWYHWQQAVNALFMKIKFILELFRVQFHFYLWHFTWQIWKWIVVVTEIDLISLIELIKMARCFPSLKIVCETFPIVYEVRYFESEWLYERNISKAWLQLDRLPHCQSIFFIGFFMS